MSVIPQNLQMKILMWSNKNPNILKRDFLIWSNMDPKIKATCAQIEMLNELIWKAFGKNKTINL
jgi:hypothetical protein